jgi:hypothetical protein
LNIAQPDSRTATTTTETMAGERTQDLASTDDHLEYDAPAPGSDSCRIYTTPDTAQMGRRGRDAAW